MSAGGLVVKACAPLLGLLQGQTTKTASSPRRPSGGDVAGDFLAACGHGPDGALCVLRASAVKRVPPPLISACPSPCRRDPSPPASGAASCTSNSTRFTALGAPEAQGRRNVIAHGKGFFETHEHQVIAAGLQIHGRGGGYHDALGDGPHPHDPAGHAGLVQFQAGGLEGSSASTSVSGAWPVLVDCQVSRSRGRAGRGGAAPGAGRWPRSPSLYP